MTLLEAEKANADQAPTSSLTVDVPTGGAAPWWQEGLHPARMCPAQAGDGPHAVSIARADTQRPVAQAAGLVVGLGAGGAAVDDEDAQVAVLVHRCVWCKAILVAVGAQLSSLVEHRWYELAAPEAGICQSRAAREAARLEIADDPDYDEVVLPDPPECG